MGTLLELQFFLHINIHIEFQNMQFQGHRRLLQILMGVIFGKKGLNWSQDLAKKELFEKI